jgi:hypothetical protein
MWTNESKGNTSCFFTIAWKFQTVLILLTYKTQSWTINQPKISSALLSRVVEDEVTLLPTEVLLRGIQLTFVQQLNNCTFWSIIVVITLEQCAHRTPTGVRERHTDLIKSKNFIGSTIYTVEPQWHWTCVSWIPRSRIANWLNLRVQKVIYAAYTVGWVDIGIRTTVRLGKVHFVAKVCKICFKTFLVHWLLPHRCTLLGPCSTYRSKMIFFTIYGLWVSNDA